MASLPPRVMIRPAQMPAMSRNKPVPHKVMKLVMKWDWERFSAVSG